MIAKAFRIISNSSKHLTKELIAQALLDQVTLKDNEKKAFFAVTECADSMAESAKECSLVAELD